jgi:hypothetical protein
LAKQFARHPTIIAIVEPRASMFKVSPGLRRQEANPVLREIVELKSVDALIALCQTRAPNKRLKYPETPRDGFISDDRGIEIRRWFGGLKPVGFGE